MPNSNDYPITLDHIKANCPEWVRWIVVDRSGVIYGFENKPFASEPFGTWSSAESKRIELMRGVKHRPWYSDWRKSLVEVVRETDYQKWMGKLCWFWDDNPEQKCTGTYYTQEAGSRGRFIMLGSNGARWRNCRPLTREEALALVVEGE